MDLDAWINEPPSESEDESVPTQARYENTSQNLFSGNKRENFYHGSNLDSYSGEGSGHAPTKTYAEPSNEELKKQRENRKESEKMNPFYLKDSGKSKAASKVSPRSFLTRGFAQLGHCRCKQHQRHRAAQTVHKRRHLAAACPEAPSCPYPISSTGKRRSTRRIAV